MKELLQFESYVNQIVPEGWQDIYAANKNSITDPNKIYPGQKLTLPSGGTYTVKPGDTLSKIAQASGQGAKRTAPKLDPGVPTQPAQPSKLPATQQKALSGLQTADDFVRSMANAATFGYADKAAAWLASKTGGKDYDTELKQQYAKSAEAGERSPTATLGGEVAGLVSSPAFAGGAALGTKALARAIPQAGNLAKFAAGTTAGLATDTAAEKLAKKVDPQNPHIQERSNRMKSKEFLRKKTEEGKASAFGKVVSQLGGGAEALPASVVRKGGQNWEKVRGVSDLKYYNPASREVKSLDDLKRAVDPSLKKAAEPKAFRRGEPPITPAAASTGTVTTKGGKPLGRGTTAALAALGGGLVGYGLGSGKEGEGPMPTPPTPSPAIIGGPDSFTPQRPQKDDFDDLVSVKPSNDDTPGSENWLRRRVNQPSDSVTNKPDSIETGKEDPSVTAARAAAAEKLADIQRSADFAKAAREKPVASDGEAAKPSADNKFSPGSQQWLDKATKTNESQLSLKTLKFLAGLTKK